MNAHDLKHLQTLMSKRQSELTVAKEEHKKAQQKMTQLQHEVKSLSLRIAQFTEGGLRVSEHALLRFAERCAGFDILATENQIRGEILERQKVLGNGKYPLACGAVAVVRENMVVTIETPQI